jgi:hypothetical protein
VRYFLSQHISWEFDGKKVEMGEETVEVGQGKTA